MRWTWGWLNLFGAVGIQARLLWMLLGLRGGILLMWKEETISDSEAVQGMFSISIRNRTNHVFDSWVTGVYGPACTKNREKLCQEIYDLYGLCNGFWCIGGVFNVVRWSFEKSAKGRCTKSMRRFNLLISELQLVDISLWNRLFSWSRMEERMVA